MKQILFHVYDETTGAILTAPSFSASKAASILDNVQPGEAWVEVPTHFDPNAFYIDITDPQNPVVAPRPAWAAPFPATGAAPLSVDISGSPAGTTFDLENEAGERASVAGSQGPITFTDRGVYKVQISPPWPHQTASTKVTVT